MVHLELHRALWIGPHVSISHSFFLYHPEGGVAQLLTGREVLTRRINLRPQLRALVDAVGTNSESAT